MSMATSGVRAIVIGGGIGGLCTGLALRRVGITATVFERMREVRVGSGLTVWTNAMKALHRLGVGDAVWASGTPLTRFQTRTWRGDLLASVSVDAMGRELGAESAGVQRAKLQAVLLEALGEDSLRRGVTFVGYEQDDAGVTARFADGREERGDLLVGADGTNSTIRALCLGPAAPLYAGYAGWGSDTRFDVTQFPPGTFVVTHGKGSAFGIIPAGGGVVAWFGTLRTEAGGTDAPGGRKRELLERFRGWHEPIEAIIEATDESRILRTDIHARKPVPRWGQGRVTLLGDAAHPLVPTLGQGACLAIEDAVVLAKCLSDGRGVTAALRLYEGQRRPRTAAIQRQAWFLKSVFHRRSRWGMLLRDTFFRMQTLPPAMKALRKVVGYEPPSLG
jgi:FAD-dependent urate hydroxylase